jgi:hypothetical protein
VRGVFTEVNEGNQQNVKQTAGKVATDVAARASAASAPSR